MLVLGRHARAVSSRARAPRAIRPSIPSRPLSALLPLSYNESSTDSSPSVSKAAALSFSASLEASATHTASEAETAKPFLEDVSEEYGYDARATEERQLSESLMTAVELRDFESAESIHKSMTESGFTIQRHPEFGSFALELLKELEAASRSGRARKVGATDSYKKAPTFPQVLKWWKLAPEALEDRPLWPARVNQFCELLVSPYISVADARQGALLTASKGYAHEVKRVIPRIVRFSINPSQSQSFIESVNSYDIKFYGGGNDKVWEDRYGTAQASESGNFTPVKHGVNLEGNARRRVASRWCLAVRTHALEGRITIASRLLIHVLETLPRHVGTYTYLLVLDGLRSLRQPKKRDEEHFIEIWRHVELYCSSWAVQFLRNYLNSRSPGLVKKKNTTLTIRRIRSLGAGMRVYMPTPKLLAAWMKSCQTEGRYRLMQLLLRRWQRLGKAESIQKLRSRSYRREKLWGIAEMRLALDEQQPLAVIKTYLAYFSIEGVPGREVVERLMRSGVSVANEAHNVSPLLGFDALGGLKYRLRPPADAVDILVQALLMPFPRDLRKKIRLSEKARALEVYNDVVKMGESQTTTESPTSHNITSSVVFPDPVTFQHFLSSPHFQHVDDMGRIISDMNCLNIQPSRQNWTTIAHALAMDGQDEKVLLLLTRMEQGFAEDTMRRRFGPRFVHDGQFASSDPATYLSAISGALVNGHTELAARVLKKFEAIELHLRNMDDNTEEIFEYLKQKLADAEWKVQAGLLKPKQTGGKLKRTTW